MRGLTHSHIYIYIYGTPPWDLPQSILIYCLYIYIYIYYLYIYYLYIYIYLCAYMYKSQLFFKDVLWVVAVHTIKTSWKQKNNIWRLFWRESMGKSQKKQKTSRKPTKNNIWRLFGKALLTKSKKPRENQKTKKTKLFRECLVWGSCLVFFGFAEFFLFFFLVLTLKRLKNLKVFCFFDKMIVKEVWKTKKLRFFFGFWVFVALVSFWLRNEKPKKTLSFFGFSHFFNHHFIQKTKNLEFF